MLILLGSWYVTQISSKTLMPLFLCALTSAGYHHPEPRSSKEWWLTEVRACGAGWRVPKSKGLRTSSLEVQTQEKIHLSSGRGCVPFFCLFYLGLGQTVIPVSVAEGKPSLLITDSNANLTKKPSQLHQYNVCQLTAHWSFLSPVKVAYDISHLRGRETQSLESLLSLQRSSIPQNHSHL